MSDHSDNFLIERANSSALTTFRRAPPEDIPDECKLCDANPALFHVRRIPGLPA